MGFLSAYLPKNWILLLGAIALSGCRSLQVPVGALLAPAMPSLAGLEPPLAVQWRRDVEAAPGLALEVGRMLFVTNRKGDIHAFELPEGRKRGVLDVGRDLMGQPVLQEALLLLPVALDGSAVIGYDLYRRQTAWRRAGEGVEAGLWQAGALVYVADRRGQIYALEGVTGQVRWQQFPEITGLEGVRARPVVVQDILIVADKRGRIVGLDAETGSLRWHQEGFGPVYADLLSAGDQVLIATTRGRLVAIAAQTGALLWMQTWPDTSVHLTTPTIADNRIYVAGGDGSICAIDLKTGMRLWSWQGPAAVVAAPVAVPERGLLYAGDLNGTLYALDLHSGAVRWQLEGLGDVLHLVRTAYGLVALCRPRHVYLLQTTHETLAVSP